MHEKSNRIVWIDAVRIYAMVCILISHTLGSRIGFADNIAMKLVIGSAVFFFMASGALVLPLSKPAGTWLKGRFLAIGIPMVIWGVFYAFIFLLKSPDYYYYPLWKRLLSIFIAQRGSLWFLNALLGLYLIVPLISPWIKQASRRQVEILIFLWFLTGCYNYFNTFFAIGLEKHIMFSIAGALYSFFGYFIAGYYFMHWPLKQQSKRRIACIIGILLFFSMFGAIFFGPAIRNNVSDLLLNDLSVNNMAWFTLIFALFSCLPTLSEKVGKAISFMARGVFGAYLSMDAVLSLVIAPYIENPVIATVVCIALCFTIGLTLRHIPKLGKYLS